MSSASAAGRVAVVGAGVGGLVAAIRLAEAGMQVEVFDPAPRAGGLAGGIETGGGSVERFYHHIFRSDIVVQRWIHALGLAPRLEFLRADMGFYSGGRMYAFGTPLSLLRFTALPFTDRLKLGLRISRLSRISAPDQFEDHSARDWLKRRVSEAEMRVFWEPLLGAKFGIDLDKVSMAWLWARFRARAGGSVGRSERLGYLRGGFQQLGDALTKRAASLGVQLHFGTRVSAVLTDSGRVRALATTPIGDVATDAVIWTPSLAALPSAVADLPPEYAARCAAIRYHHAISVLVELPRSALPYYWVTVADPTLPFTVAVEHTRLLPADDYGGRTLAYLGRYAPPEDPVASASPEEVRDLFIEAAARAFSPVFANPIATYVSRAPAAQPVTPPGWAAARPPLRTGLPGLVTANMAQIYPWDRGMNYSMELGESAAEAALDEIRDLRSVS
ncbi:MAG: FAD-dependent oxidoreductase [Candidatus Dormibacteraeota bacterium]|nr:FAD-dependent oxidoreductase [Candidatus Dormibacteraeota bacterium]